MLKFTYVECQIKIIKKNSIKLYKLKNKYFLMLKTVLNIEGLIRNQKMYYKLYLATIVGCLTKLKKYQLIELVWQCVD